MYAYICPRSTSSLVGQGTAKTIAIIESQHCPYLVPPNMVSELMLDFISVVQPYHPSITLGYKERICPKKWSQTRAKSEQNMLVMLVRLIQTLLSGYMSPSSLSYSAHQGPLCWSGQSQRPCESIPHSHCGPWGCTTHF